MAEVIFREATEKDIDQVALLVARLKRLNEEFDPLLKVSEKLEESCKEYVKKSIGSRDYLVIVAEHEGRIVGVLKAGFIDRVFYDPPLEGQIQEFYILPKYRRMGLGKKMLEYAIDKLRGRVSFITASFPSLNTIAISFYERFGFRPIFNVYARETSERSS
ncbi:MAG: GNAT family N-acetyltransferase [Candidatus Caldarchaeales archaeon]